MAPPVPTLPHNFRGAFYEPITPSEEEFAPDTPVTENQNTELEHQEAKAGSRDAISEQNAANLESQDDATPVNPRFAKLLRRCGNSWPYLIIAAQWVFCVLTMMALSPELRQCIARRPFYSPVFKDIQTDSYEQVRFQGAMEDQNVYKGAPNHALDSAWENLLHRNKSVVNVEVIDRIKKSRDAVKYPKAQGGQYYVDIEVFHQMRCLNLIRQYTYHDYYTRPEHRPDDYPQNEETIRNEVDHCIDILRQALLCYGDMGIITANWAEDGSGRVVPDYSTEHKCPKFNKIVEWADRNAAPDVEPEREPEDMS